MACDKFIYIEILKSSTHNEPSVVNETPKHEVVKKSLIYKLDKKFISLVTSSINDIADEDGWAFLGDVGNLLIKKRPDFDPRNYGFEKLTPLIKSLKKHFNIDERDTDRATIKHVYIRAKK